MEFVKNIKNKHVAILVTNGFEEIELSAPKKELAGYGATVHIVSDEPKIRSWKNHHWGNDFETDRFLDNFHVNDYEILIIPGGVINSDRLRRNGKAIEIIKEFNKSNKPIAAICHGPQVLIDADILKGRTLTAHRAIKTDIKNAGANYKNHGVVRNGNIISAQGPADVSSFLKEIISTLKMMN